MRFMTNLLAQTAVCNPIGTPCLNEFVTDIFPKAAIIVNEAVLLTNPSTKERIVEHNNEGGPRQRIGEEYIASFFFEAHG